MSLHVWGEGRAGEIFIQDDRPDGTVVLLTCTEVATRSEELFGQAQQAGDEGSVGVASSSAADGSVYPLFREHGVARRPQFKLHVDTTNLEGGILKFAMSKFTRASLRAADEGKREIHLNGSNAAEWGYLGPLESGSGREQAQERRNEVADSASKFSTSDPADRVDLSGPADEVES
jgi:hypothetical protein